MQKHAQHILILSLLAPGVFLTGCDVQTGNSTVREVGIQVSGFYTNPNGGAMVTSNSGLDVTQMGISQEGDRLIATDNNGRIYRGSIGQTDGSTASFTLNGSSINLGIVADEVTISGSFSIDGATLTIRGTWIEPSRFGEVFGTSSVNANPVPASDNAATGGGDSGGGDSGGGDSGGGDSGGGGSGGGGDGGGDTGPVLVIPDTGFPPLPI